MESYDSVAIWGLKGKAIYLAGGIPLGLLKNANYLTAHPDYPLLVPIQEAVFYFISGCLRDAAAKAIFPMYYLALIFVFYFVLKTLFERKQALIFTFILGTVPQIANYATNGYADLVVAFYYSAGFFFIYLWFSERDMKFIPLSALFSAMGAWTKNEGIPLALLNLAVLAAGIFSAELRRDKKIFRDALKGLFFYAAILALFTLPWEAFKAYHGLKGDLATAETFSIPRAIINLKRIPVILYEYQKQLFGFKKWNIVWALILVSFVFNFKKAFSRQAAPIAISLGGCFLIYTAVYILTPKDFVWHISTSASRLFLHIAPVAALWLAVNFKGSDFDR
jgi:4-amino-4-deoxy-L-arabinose transferase-like glycosyltransferase